MAVKISKHNLVYIILAVGIIAVFWNCVIPRLIALSATYWPNLKETYDHVHMSLRLVFGTARCVPISVGSIKYLIELFNQRLYYDTGHRNAKLRSIIVYEATLQ